jgi:protocatechuate 3,4-dioxygenase beta subunit
MKLDLWLLCGALSLCGFQAPPAERPKDEKCLIEGRVVNAVTGEVVRKATLLLTHRGGTATPSTAETDDTGRFAFRDLEPGSYLLLAERPGFARQAYGARSNPLSGTTLLLSAAQRLKDLTFRLAPNSIISGRVVDEEGEPVQNAVVMALRAAYQRGERQYVPLGAVQSNDMGEFRIASLTAGRYLVAAAPVNLGLGVAGASNEPPTDRPESGYVTTYYPNSTDPSLASPVQVGIGADAAGTDIRLVKTTTVRIKGKVVGGSLGKQVVVTLTRRGTGALGLVTRKLAIAQQADGAFDVKGVPPGSYVLGAITADNPLSSGASLPVQIGEQHIDGVILSLGGGGELTGTVTVESKEPMKLGSVQVVLQSLEFLSLNTPRATPGDDGKFTLKDVSPDRYQVAVVNGPENSYIKSVRHGNQEVPEAQIDLSGGVAGTLQVDLSQAGAQVDGAIRDGEDKPMSGATVVLIPDSRQHWLYRVTTSDQNGGFSFKGVTPGEYKILAWEDVETGAYQESEFLKQFESQAQAVSLKENDRKSVSLRAIPLDKEI